MWEKILTFRNTWIGGLDAMMMSEMLLYIKYNRLYLHRELYLDGNNLMCEGACELIKLCVEQAELEALMRAEEAKKKLEEEEAIKTAGKQITMVQNLGSYLPTIL